MSEFSDARADENQVITFIPPNKWMKNPRRFSQHWSETPQISVVPVYSLEDEAPKLAVWASS